MIDNNYKYSYLFIFQESCTEFEHLVTAQCDALITAILNRRDYLLEAIRCDREAKLRALKVILYFFIFLKNFSTYFNIDFYALIKFRTRHQLLQENYNTRQV